jgi:hypothetical protein
MSSREIEWDVYYEERVYRHFETVHLGTVFAASEQEARHAALYKFDNFIGPDSAFWVNRR